MTVGGLTALTALAETSASAATSSAVSAPVSGEGTQQSPYVVTAKVTVPALDMRTDAVDEVGGATNLAAFRCDGTAQVPDGDALAYSVGIAMFVPASLQTVTWTPRFPGGVDDGCSDGTFHTHFLGGSVTLKAGTGRVPSETSLNGFATTQLGLKPGAWYTFRFTSAPDVTVVDHHRRAATSSATKAAVFFNKAGKTIYRGAGKKIPAAKRNKVASWTTTVAFDGWANQPVSWSRLVGKKTVTSTVTTNSAGVATFRFTKNLGTYTGFQQVTKVSAAPLCFKHPVATVTAPASPGHYAAFVYPFGPMQAGACK